MSKQPGVYAISESVAVSPGGVVSIPLKLQKGLKSADGKKAHVTALALVFSGVTLGAVGANTTFDAPFWSQLVTSIQLDASADSPFGKRNGGQLIKNMSLYLALTALNNMTNAPAMAFGGGAAHRAPPGTLPQGADPEAQQSTTAVFQSRRLKGRLHTQGPFGGAANGDPAINGGELCFILPIGQRMGEKNGENALPLSYLNGGGESCDAACPSKSEGSISLTLASTMNGIAVSAVSSVRVFAHIVFRDELNAACLQPFVTTYQTTDLVMQFPPMIHGFTALCEDLTAGGNMQLPDTTGVTQRILMLGNMKAYESQYSQARALWCALNSVNGEMLDEFAAVDPSVTDAYVGPLSLARFNTPFIPIINHTGDTGTDPSHDGKCSLPCSFELVGASGATNRRVLRGGWLPQDAEYVGAAEKFAGSPLVPSVPMGALPSAAKGLITGLPMQTAVKSGA